MTNDAPAKATPMREGVTQADRDVCGVIHGLIRRAMDDRAYLVAAAHRLAHPAAPQGEEDTRAEIKRLREALQLCHDVMHECTAVLNARDRNVMSGAMLIARAALDPAAIASGRERAE